jgi:hypothetical protein
MSDNPCTRLIRLLGAVPNPSGLACLADHLRSEDFVSAGCMGLAAARPRASGMAIIGTALAPDKIYSWHASLRR